MKLLLVLLYIVFFWYAFASANISSEVFNNRIHDLVPDLLKMIDSYIEHHNISAVINDPNFCDRKFVIGTYSCPSMIGNRMTEFLNSFIAAFTLNRTLIWRVCTRKGCWDNEADCNEYLTRLDWIPSYSIVSELYQKKCTNRTEIVNFLPVRHEKSQYRAAEILICCGIHQLYYNFLDFGILQLHEMFVLSLNTTKLSIKSKERINLLFSISEDFGYGLLFRLTFSFVTSIQETNNQLIQKDLLNHSKENRNPFYISLHLRHTINEVNVSEHGEFECVQKIIENFHLNEINSVNRCVILFASDRESQINHWDRLKDLPYCSIITTNHSIGKHAYHNEQGPFTGKIAMNDMELLSRGHISIGSSYQHPFHRYELSTFSMLIASLQVTNEKNISTLYQSQSLTLPNCKSCRGGKIILEPWYMDDFDCLNDIKDLTLPDGCLPKNVSNFNKEGEKDV